MNRREKAIEAFESGYNCAQALMKSFSDLIDADEDMLLSLVSSFGGGMGRLREVCGAVSGMLAVLGILYGYSGPEKGERKAEHYTRVQETSLEFERMHGSLICRELLGLKPGHDTPQPTPRTEAFYGKRPCGGFIGDAAEILEKYIKAHPLNQTGSRRSF